MPSRSASLSPAMNSSWRPNKLYRCPPTPPPEQRRHREHAFILDGVAASNISTECAQYTCKFISIYPPYDAINDVNARGYFRAKGVRKTLKRTGQGNVLTKVVPGVGESSTMPKNSVDADGNTLLTEKTQILQRWAEHFRGVLNRPSVISDAAIDRLLQVETNVDLDLPPSLQETIRTLQQLSSGKAPGSDAIPAEVYKHGGPQLMDHLTALFQEMWRQGEVLQDFKDATIVHLYKRKGNRQVYDNHRGISLLNIAGKIFARILLNRLNNHLEQGLLPESQCGFRHHRGTTDMIFAARQLQEKCQEMRTHLYSTFVDLTKAFDTVNREGLWKIMQKFSCPERFTQMVRQLHDGMMARVTDNGAVSEAFAVTNGVKQGCVLAPTLFSLMFSAMLMDAYRDERPGIRIAYRTDGHLLNQRRMHFQSRVSTTTVHELLFADDCALNTISEEEMQRSMDLFSAACENFGLVINTQKTVVMHQPPPNSATAPNAPPQISMNGTQLQVVENFPYLSSTLSRNTKIDDEVANRISKASQAFGRLQSTETGRSPSTISQTASCQQSRPCASSSENAKEDEKCVLTATTLMRSQFDLEEGRASP
nr:unnamed protein product [Spirometra erinaceieuropaei]